MRRLIGALIALGLAAQTPAQSLDFGARGQAAKALGRRPVLPSNKGTLLIKTGLFSSGVMSGPNPWTWFDTFPIPAHFYAWRPVFGNIATSPMTVTGVVARASATASDYQTPTGSASWCYNTAANAGALSGANVDMPRDCAASLAAATGYPLTLAAAANDPVTGVLVPTYVAGDWNFIDSLDAPAGSNAHYLMVRTLVPVQNPWGGATVLANNTGWTGDAAINAGFDYANYFCANDYVTTPGNSCTLAGASSTPIVAIQYLTDRGVINMGWTGDSHFAGDTTTRDLANFGLRSALQLTNETGIAFSPVNAAWGGASSGLYQPNAANVFAFAEPQIVLVPLWTANDANVTQANVDKSFARVLATAARLRSKGSLPVLIGPLCRDATTMAVTGRLAQWQYLRGRLLEAGRHGQVVVDASAAICDLTTGTYRAGFSSDTVHPNDAGTAALVPLVKAAVKRGLGI